MQKLCTALRGTSIPQTLQEEQPSCPVCRVNWAAAGTSTGMAQPQHCMASKRLSLGTAQPQHKPALARINLGTVAPATPGPAELAAEAVMRLGSEMLVHPAEEGDASCCPAASWHHSQTPPSSSDTSQETARHTWTKKKQQERSQHA